MDEIPLIPFARGPFTLKMAKHSFLDLDKKNKQRSISNILSKDNLTKFEMDEIFLEMDD